MTRTDIHRPSQINPSDYDFVCYEYLGNDAGDWHYLAQQRRWREEHVARTGGSMSRHAHGGSCHVCGAHAIYTALFHHRPSNVYIRTGLDCADNMEHGDADAFRRTAHAAIEAARGVRKAKEIIFGKFADEQANWIWGIYNAPINNFASDERGTIPYEIVTVRDIVGKLVRYGSISDNAARYLGTLRTKYESRATVAAERAAAQAAALPVPTGKVTVRGKVLTIKSQDSVYGPVTKMLVQHADGWKVWGSKPGALEVERGAVVEFSATIEASPEDNKFGFFKRPTKAKIIQTTEAA